MNGIAVAGGAVEGREVAIGADGSCEDVVQSLQKGEALGLLRSTQGNALSFCKNEGGGFGVGEDDVHFSWFQRR